MANQLDCFVLALKSQCCYSAQLGLIGLSVFGDSNLSSAERKMATTIILLSQSFAAPLSAMTAVHSISTPSELETRPVTPTQVEAAR